jgi:hypothetical protein
MLGRKQRLELVKVLKGLPLSQLLEIEFALDIPEDIMPGLSAPKGERPIFMLRYLEGPTGCGIDELLEILEAMEIQPFKEKAVSSEEKAILKLILDGSLDDVLRQKILEINVELKDYAQDESIQIRGVSSGSIIVEVEGSSETIKALENVLISQRISSLSGLAIREFSFQGYSTVKASTFYTRIIVIILGVSLLFSAITALDVLIGSVNEGDKELLEYIEESSLDRNDFPDDYFSSMEIEDLETEDSNDPEKTPQPREADSSGPTETPQPDPVIERRNTPEETSTPIAGGGGEADQNPGDEGGGPNPEENQGSQEERSDDPGANDDSSGANDNNPDPGNDSSGAGNDNPGTDNSDADNNEVDDSRHDESEGDGETPEGNGGSINLPDVLIDTPLFPFPLPEEEEEEGGPI